MRRVVVLLALLALVATAAPAHGSGPGADRFRAIARQVPMVVYKPTATLGQPLAGARVGTTCGASRTRGQVSAHYGPYVFPGTRMLNPFVIEIFEGSPLPCANLGLSALVARPLINGSRGRLYCAIDPSRRGCARPRDLSLVFCKRGTQIWVGGGSKVTARQIVAVARSMVAMPGGRASRCAPLA